MIDDDTRRRLRELGLPEMVDVLDMQARDVTCMQMAFEERMRMAVDYVYEEKRADSVKRMTARARFRFPQADLTSMIYEARGIDRVLVQELGTCQFVHGATNVIIEGCTGTGNYA